MNDTGHELCRKLREAKEALKKAKQTYRQAYVDKEAAQRKLEAAREAMGAHFRPDLPPDAR